MSQTPVPVDAAERALVVDLLVTSARFARLAARVSHTELPAALWRGLSLIDELEPVRIGDLAAADRSSQPAATTLVQRLAENGWVSRTPDPDDARAVRISLTDAGRARLATARQQAVDALLPVVESLAPEQREELAAGVRVLEAIVRGTAG